MYSGTAVTISLIRVVLAFLFLFAWLPGPLLGPTGDGDRLEAFWSNYLRMTLVVILAVYLLAALRIYELMSLAAVMAGIWAVRAGRADGRQAMESRRSRLVKGVYAFLDNPQLRAGAVAGRFQAWLAQGHRFPGGRSRGLLTGCLAVAVLAGSAYLRFRDALVHAAPGLSDAYVTLAWMKYVENRQLFHDGIYPHGFHIILSAVRKLAGVDPLFVLKYVGPLNGVLIVLSVYFILKKLTGRHLPAVAGAFAYGILAGELPMEFVRQAATNSQEFALALVLPSIWFGFAYLQSERPRHLFLACCGLAVMGLSHPLTAAFAAAGLGAAVLAAAGTGRLPFRRLWRLAQGMGGAVAVAFAPMGLGLLMGKEFHGSSLEFATETSQLPIPPLTVPVVIGLLAGMAALVRAVILYGRGRQSTNGLQGAAYLVGFLVAAATVIYQSQRFGLDSVAVTARSGEIMSLALAVAYGYLWHLLQPRGGPVPAILVLAVLLYLRPPVPPEPYKMQSDESVEQYLRIARGYPPTEWLMVSGPEGYALVLGKGWHLQIEDFLERYPATRPLYRPGGDQGDGGEGLSVPHVFLFVDKETFRRPVIAGAPPRADDRELMERLQLWAETYGRDHGDLEVFYEGETLTVYHIQRDMTPEEHFRRVWGDGAVPGRGRVEGAGSGF